MGQLDNQLERQPAGDQKPHLHINIKFLDDIADHPAQAQAATKTEQSESESAQINQARPEQAATVKPAASAQEPLNEKPANSFHNKTVEGEFLRNSLMMPSIWHEAGKKAGNILPAINKDFKNEALNERSIDLDKFRDVQARWLENKSAKEDAEQEAGSKAEAERRKEFCHKTLDTIAAFIAPSSGAISEAAIRHVDRVPLDDKRMGKIGLVGALAGGVIGGTDLLIRSQTKPNSAAYDAFTPSSIELVYTGAATAAPMPIKYRILLGAGFWLANKAANYYFSDKK